MRVAIISELYHPSKGGMEYRLARFAELLLERGVEVAVYTSDHLGYLPKEEEIGGVPVIRYVRIPGYVRGSYRDPRGLIELIRATRNIVKGLDAEIILVNQMPVVHLPFLPRRIAVDWCEYPTVRAVNWLVRLSLRRHKRGTVVAEHVLSNLKADVRNADLRVVHTPIDPSKYEPATNGRNPDEFLYLGRLVPHKKVDFLIEYFGRLNPNKRLLIAGSGVQRHRVEELAAKYHNVDYLGSVTEEEKLALMRKTGFLITASKREGFPVTIAESISVGLPVAAVAGSSMAPLVKELDLGIVIDPSKPIGEVRDYGHLTMKVLSKRRLFDPLRVGAELLGIFRRWSYEGSGDWR